MARDDRAALREYRKTHWGLGGNGAIAKLAAPDPRHGTLVELGALVAVVYETRKLGDGGLVQYEHEFGRAGRGRPILAFNETGLVVVSGGYRVTTRGIVG